MSTYRSSQIYDCNLEWTFPSESFDYIHIRFLAASVADWGALFKEAYRCLKPGGYLESMEPSPHLKSDDGSVDPESAMAMWANIFVKGGKKSGRTWTVVDDDVQEKGMADAGFEKLDVTSFKVRNSSGCLSGKGYTTRQNVTQLLGSNPMVWYTVTDTDS